MPVGKPIDIPVGMPIGMPIDMPIGMPIGVPIGMPIGMPACADLFASANEGLGSRKSRPRDKREHDECEGARKARAREYANWNLIHGLKRMRNVLKPGRNVTYSRLVHKFPSMQSGIHTNRHKHTRHSTQKTSHTLCTRTTPTQAA